jgi:hypothetical protein
VLLERYDCPGGEPPEALLALLDCRRRKGRDGTRYVEKYEEVMMYMEMILSLE